MQNVQVLSQPTLMLTHALAACLGLPESHFDDAFDGVFSHGVFLYFSDLAYAARVLEEMTRVASPAEKP